MARWRGWLLLALALVAVGLGLIALHLARSEGSEEPTARADGPAPQRASGPDLPVPAAGPAGPEAPVEPPPGVEPQAAPADADVMADGWLIEATEPYDPPPDIPPRAEIVRAMAAVKPAVEACAEERHFAVVRIRFRGEDGRVDETSSRATLPEPVRDCVFRAVETAQVGAFGRETFSITWPFRTGSRESAGSDAVASARAGLTEVQMQQVLETHRDEIVSCYREALRHPEEPPPLHIQLELVISADGRVVRAGASSVGMVSSLVRCVVRAARQWTFPSAERSSRTTVPFIFR